MVETRFPFGGVVAPLAGPPEISYLIGRIEIMIFTTKAEYGVRLLVELGRQASGQPVSLEL